MSGESADLEVSADAALQFVKTIAHRGGALRLLATGVAVSATLMLGGAALAVGGVAALGLAGGALVSGAVTARNLVQNRAADYEAIRRAVRLPQPVMAFVIDGRLLVGTVGTPRVTWCDIGLSPAEELHIRTLALPTARIR